MELGIAPERQALTAQSPKVVIGITHAVLHEGFWQQLPFWWYSGKVIASLKAQPGFLGKHLRRYFWRGEAWTVTIWSDEANLDQFVANVPHRTAMLQGRETLASARFARVCLARQELPLTWERVESLMLQHGRAMRPAPSPGSEANAIEKKTPVCG